MLEEPDKIKYPISHALYELAIELAKAYEIGKQLKRRQEMQNYINLIKLLKDCGLTVNPLYRVDYAETSTQPEYIYINDN